MPQPALQVAALETEHCFGDVDGALARIETLVRALRGVDLVLLSEAALTGYVSAEGDFDLSPFAEPLDGPLASRLAELARGGGVGLAAPLIERDGDHAYNALVLFDRDGARIGHYRKRHPWVPERWATGGDRPTSVVAFEGLSLALAICFDIHFLARESRAALALADALLFPSAWVDGDHPKDTRGAILPALARRHGIWVVNANWGLSRPRLPGQGESQILDPSGAVIAAARRGAAPQIVQARITRRKPAGDDP